MLELWTRHFLGDIYFDMTPDTKVSVHRSISKSKLQPNVYSCNSAISSSEKASLWLQALSFFSALPEVTVQPNVVNYNTSISSCNGEGQWQHALSLLEGMVYLKVQASVVSFGAAMMSRSESWPWETGWWFQIFYDMFV